MLTKTRTRTKTKTNAYEKILNYVSHKTDVYVSIFNHYPQIRRKLFALHTAGAWQTSKRMSRKQRTTIKIAARVTGIWLSLLFQRNATQQTNAKNVATKTQKKTATISKTMT